MTDDLAVLGSPLESGFQIRAYVFMTVGLRACPALGIAMAQMRCSICGRAFDPEQIQAMPFCSQRCKDIDRNRWLNEEYGLPWEPEVERPEGTGPSADDRGG